MSINSKMTGIADRIRSLLGISGKLGLDAMNTNLETANEEVATQGELMEQILTALDGKSVGGVKEEQEKSVDIAENGTTEVLPDDGKVLSKVTVNVDVQSSVDNSMAVGLIDGSLIDAIIPREVINIRTQGFRDMANLKSVHFHNELKNVGTNAFYACKGLESITWEEPAHDGHRLNGYAFQNCTSLKEIVFPLNIYGIDGNCFAGCTGLTKVTIKEYPWNGMATTAFNNCTNLLDIYVPWAEGEKANAPWGATNATIHYNSVV